MTDSVTTMNVEEHLSKVRVDLEHAEQGEREAEQAWSHVAALNALAEANDQDVADALLAHQDARTKSAALRGAVALLERREKDAEAARTADKVQRLRAESRAAKAAQDKALHQVANLSEALSKALSAVSAQGSVIDGVYRSLVAHDPERAQEIEADHRDDLARIGTIFAAKRGEIRNAASSGQYRLQDAGDGVDRILPEDLVLLGEVVAAAGTKQSAARSFVLDWEVASLARLDDELHHAQQQAFEEHAARVEIGLGAQLGASLEEVRSAGNLEVEHLALLISDEAARSLANLTAYLPASASEGVSVRSAPRSALEAKQGEARLQSGLAALRGLVGG